MTTNMNLIILVTTIALLLAAGCGSGQTTEDTTPQTGEEQPVDQGTTAVSTTNDGGVEAGGESSQGAQLVEERCVTCHDLDTVYSHTFSREQWLEQVNLMVSRGARLTEEERDIVVDYLSSR